MSTNKDNYQIIWKHFKPGSAVGKSLNATTAFSLPYFVDGMENEQLKKQQQVDLTTIHLIKGLLVGYFDQPPGVDITFAQNQAKSILTDLIDQSKGQTIEALILDISNDLRERNGALVSMQALIGGIELADNHDPLKYDCCIDLITCIDDELLENKSAGVEKLKQLLSEINVDKLHPELIKDYKQMQMIVLEYD